MEGNNSMTPSEEIEKKFKEFIDKLLEAQSYDFMKEKVLFSRKTLQKTMTEFCNIIAEEVDCDSCTIHLQMYDSKLIGEELFKELIAEYLYRTRLLETSISYINAHSKKRISKKKLHNYLKKWLDNELGIKKIEKEVIEKFNSFIEPHLKGDKDKVIGELQELIKSRIELLESSLTFPYWAHEFEKGVASLVAVNTGSPWLPVFEDEKSELKYISLFGGISKTIYQENVARVRDRLSIRETRNFRKLGQAEMVVWKNTEWKNIFKNYYGAPIRIHSGGEVLGILKAENKKTRWKNEYGDEKNVIQELLNSKDTKDLIDGIIGKIDKKFKECKDLGSLNVSFLSLVYLENDLKAKECINKKNHGFKELMFIPYPDYVISISETDSNNVIKIPEEYKNIGINSLKPVGEDKSPPMQLFTRNIDDEKELWNLLKEDDDCKSLFKKIKEFYEKFEKKIYQVIDYRIGKLSLKKDEKLDFADEINNIIPKNNYMNVVSIEIENWHTLNLPDFHFKVSLSYISGITQMSDSGGLHTFDFYMVILPTREEFRENKNIPNTEKYSEVNDIWLSKEECTLGEFCEHRKNLKGEPRGEFVVFDDSQEEVRITDLIIDRLAARIQAFAHALPVTEFSTEDTYKLKWAAYEIGKLIEREISYRANRHDDPMPLTAMEFFRIPISDLSFVDDLRSRRKNLEKISDNIDVYIKDIVFRLGMADAVKYSSRIKGYRSSLQRIGERFEGYVRGNMALWVFLLSLICENESESSIGMRLDENIVKEFLNNLGEFRRRIKTALGQDYTVFSEFKDKCNNRCLVGDLKFDSPPFMDEEKDLEGKLIEAFNRIRTNLEGEGIRGENFNNIKTSDGIDDYFSNNRKLFNGLLLRNYSHFIRDSLSLLVQIANLLKSLKNNDIDNFRKFHKKCRDLREFLCSSSQKLEGKEKYQLEEIFGIQKNSGNENNCWRKIKEFIDKYSTGTLFSSNDDEYLYLKVKSIYKRIRMLNNTLRHQMPAAALEWELGRFDLYGTRMNCLFKNQVFVLFEKIWNRGDPFFFYKRQAENYKEYCNEDGKIDVDKYHQRWLCFRTRILQGEYNACQIAALVDPKSVDLGYWEKGSIYNLKSLKSVLGKIFDEFEGETAEKYRNYSWHRHLISERYRYWYKDYSNIQQWGIQKQGSEKEKTKWFGSFLFANVINLLMLLLHVIIDFKNEKVSENRHGFGEKTMEGLASKLLEDQDIKDRFINIINNIYWVILCGVDYSSKIREGFMKPEFFSNIQFSCACAHTLIFENILEIDNEINTEYLRSRLVTSDDINNILNADKDNIAKILEKYGLSKKEKEALKEIIGDRPKKRKKSKKCREKLFCCSNNRTGECTLYQESIQLLEGLVKEVDMDISDKKIFEKIQTNLEKEKDFFKGLKKKNRIEEFQMPIFFFDRNQEDAFGHKTLINLKTFLIRLNERAYKDIPVNYWVFIYGTFERIRRDQKSYLFDIGDKSKNVAGLWMRGKKEILERIKNYVLLFSEKDRKSDFLGLNAHDLYYYVRSLIPMEIQVRTELTNTFAVQYHDNIYKEQPPVGTEFPHSMMKEAGERLEKIDREMQIDYEDYILKYHHRIEEEGEEDED